LTTSARLAAPALPGTSLAASGVDHGWIALTSAVAVSSAFVAVIVAVAGLVDAVSLPRPSTAMSAEDDVHVMPARSVMSPIEPSSKRASTVNRTLPVPSRIVSVDGVSHMCVIDSCTHTRIGMGPNVLAAGGVVVTVASTTKLRRRGVGRGSVTVIVPVAVSTVTPLREGGTEDEKKFGA
jgi:hypothetical protein